MIETLAKLNRNTLILFAVLIAGVLCPGFAFLYVFQPDAFVALDFSKLLMLSLAITTPVFLLNYLSALVGVHLFNRHISLETLNYVVPKDLPNYDEVMKGHEAEARKRDRQRVENAMLIAALVSFVPLYTPLVVNLLTEISPVAAVIVLAIAAVAVWVLGSVAALWWHQKPRTPLGGPPPSFVRGA